MLHRHHIIPHHAGGTNDRSNLEMVTVEQHADRHRVLFETHGRWQDELAWKTLSGQIGKDEARRNAASLTNTGKKYALGCKHPPRSPEWRQKQSLAKMGHVVSEETKKRLSCRMLGNQYTVGRKRPIEERIRIGLKLKDVPQTKIECPRCQKTGGVAAMKRWHFENCKHINSGYDHA